MINNKKDNLNLMAKDYIIKNIITIKKIYKQNENNNLVLELDKDNYKILDDAYKTMMINMQNIIKDKLNNKVKYQNYKLFELRINKKYHNKINYIMEFKNYNNYINYYFNKDSKNNNFKMNSNLLSQIVNRTISINMIPKIIYEYDNENNNIINISLDIILNKIIIYNNNNNNNNNTSNIFYNETERINKYKLGINTRRSIENITKIIKKYK